MDARQQQYIEMVLNNRQLIKIDKKFNNLDLDRFDVELYDNFNRKFPGSIQFKKDSASPTRVLKSKVAGKEYFVKVFSIPPTEKRQKDTEDQLSSLLYEKEIYRYIRSMAVRNKEIKKHFIQMLLSARDRKNNWGFIFTQDSGGVPLYKIQQNNSSLLEYFKDPKHRLNAQFVSNIFTQLLYVIYLLNSINIVHNDLHFGNVLIVRDNIESKEYEMYGQKFVIRDHPYSLMVYDFDMASIVSPPEWSNPFRAEICEDYGRCKDYMATDLYVWLVHLLESPDTWDFISVFEDRKYTEIVNRFKKAMRSSTSRGFFQRLFKKQDPSQLDMIQRKTSQYIQYMSKPSKQQQWKHPPPIHHASCQKFKPDSKCAHPSKPIEGDKIASAWSAAISLLSAK